MNNDDRIKTKTITGLRNGKRVTLVVETTDGGIRPGDAPWYFVRKPGGKPLFGTTGYWHPSESNVIKSYRNHVILTDVVEVQA